MSHFIQCNLQEHGPAIMAIYNKVIAESAAIYTHTPYSPEVMQEWFASRQRNGFPVIGAIDDAGFLMGFASYGLFRTFPGYSQTVEHSVYVHHLHQGKGLGGALLQRVIQSAQAQDLHLMVGVIDADNQTSIALHEKFDFEFAGTLRQAGHKFGEWRDVSFYQLILNEGLSAPANLLA